jgi:formiminotetrahydrofolate cyclodeaminase
VGGKSSAKSTPKKWLPHAYASVNIQSQSAQISLGDKTMAMEETMFTVRVFRAATAVLLALGLLISTAPVSAADLSTRSAIGSISGTGSVQLRGVSVNNEGTLFSGDQVQTGRKSYAKVILVDGNKLEISSDTQFVVNRDGGNSRVGLSSGNMAFTASKKPVAIVIGGYEVLPKVGASGNVAFVGTEGAGIRVLSGDVTVRQITTKKSFTVTSGTERILNLKTGRVDQPLVQVASMLPPSLPSTQAPAPRGGLSKTGWIAVLATLGGAATAVAVLTTGGDDEGEAAARLAQQRALQNAQAVSTTAQLAASAASSVATAAGQANTAIGAAANLPPATRTQLTARASALQSAAVATSQQIATLNTQLNQLQSQLQSASNSEAVTQIQNQINTVRNNLNSQVQTLNATIAQLNALVAQAQSAGVPNVPNVTVQPVPSAPPPASGSNP